MSRWMTYSGDPILAEELLFKPQHSIIGQSLQPGSAPPPQMATDSGPAGTAKALKDLATPKPCTFLALTFGLTDDPFEAVSRAIGFVERDGHDHRVEYTFQGTVATSNGEPIWAIRYSSEGQEPITVLLNQRCDTASAA
jgi:hypothetical protein